MYTSSVAYAPRGNKEKTKKQRHRSVHVAENKTQMDKTKKTKHKKYIIAEFQSVSTM